MNTVENKEELIKKLEAERQSPSMYNPVIAYEPFCVITREDVKNAYKVADVDMEAIKEARPDMLPYRDWVVILKALDFNQLPLPIHATLKPHDVFFNMQYERCGHRVIEALAKTIEHIADDLYKPCEVKQAYDLKSSFFDTDRHIVVNMLYAICFVPALPLDIYLMFYSVEVGELIGMLLIAISVVALIPSCIVTWNGFRHQWEAIKKVAKFIFEPFKRIFKFMDNISIL